MSLSFYTDNKSNTKAPSDITNSIRKTEKLKISSFLDSQLKTLKELSKSSSIENNNEGFHYHMKIKDNESEYMVSPQRLDKISSTPFSEKLILSRKEDDILDLISSEIKSGAIINFYKENFREKSPLSPQKISENINVKENVKVQRKMDISGFKLCQRKRQQYKHKSAQLLAEKVISMVKDHYQTFFNNYYMRFLEASKGKKLTLNLSKIKESSFDSKFSHVIISDAQRKLDIQEKTLHRDYFLPGNVSDINGYENSHPNSSLNTPFELASELNDIQSYHKNKIVSRENIPYLQQADYERKPLADIDHNSQNGYKKYNPRPSYLEYIETPSNKIAGVNTPSFVMSPFATNSHNPRKIFSIKETDNQSRDYQVERRPPIKNGGIFKDSLIIRIVKSAKNDVPLNLSRGRQLEPHTRAKTFGTTMIEESINMKEKAHRRLKSHTKILSETHDKSTYSDSTTSFAKTPFRLSFIKSNDVSVVDEKYVGTGCTTPVEKKARDNSISLALKMKALQEELFREESSDKKNDESKMSRLMQIAESLRKTSHVEVNGNFIKTSAHLNTESSSDAESNGPLKSGFHLQQITSNKMLNTYESYNKSTAFSLLDQQDYAKLSSNRRSSINSSKVAKLSFVERLRILKHSLDILQRFVNLTVNTSFQALKAYSERRQSPIKSKYREMKMTQPMNPVFSSFSTASVQSHNFFPITAEKTNQTNSPQFSARRKMLNSRTDLQNLISPRSFYEKIPHLLQFENAIMKLLRKRFRYGIDQLRLRKGSKKPMLVPDLNLSQRDEADKAVNSKENCLPFVIMANRNNSIKAPVDHFSLPTAEAVKVNKISEDKPDESPANKSNHSHLQSFPILDDDSSQKYRVPLSRMNQNESQNNSGRKSVPSSYHTPTKFTRSAEIDEIIKTGQKVAERYLSSQKKNISGKSSPNISMGVIDRSNFALSQKSLLNSPISLEEINKSFQEEKTQVIEYFDKCNLNFSKNLQFFVALDKVFRKSHKDFMWEFFWSLKQEQIDRTKDVLSPAFTFRNKNKSRTPQRVGESLCDLKKNKFIHSEIKVENSIEEEIEDKIVSSKEIIRPMLNCYLVFDNFVKLNKKFYFNLIKAYSDSSIQKNYLKRAISINTAQNTLTLAKTLEDLIHKVFRASFRQIGEHCNNTVLKERELKLKFLYSKFQEIYLKPFRSAWMKLNRFAVQHRLQESTTSKYVALGRYTEGFEKLKSNILQIQKRFLQFALNKLNKFRIRERNMTLYVVGLVQALKEIKKSRVKTFFFELKQKSQALFYRRVERTTVLNRLISKKTLKEHVSKRKLFTKWKDFSIATSRRLERRLKDIVMFVRCLSNVYKAHNKILTYSAVFQIRHHAKDKKRALSLFKSLNYLLSTRKRIAFEELQNLQSLKMKYDIIKQQLDKIDYILKKRLKKAFLMLMIQSQVANTSIFQVQLNKNVSRMISALENYRRSNLEKGIKMIELEFISKRNREKLYVNLGLKVIFLAKKKRDLYKKEFLDYLTYNMERSNQITRAIEKLTNRNYMRNLSYFFNRFRNELTNIKINRSMIDTAIKSLKLSIEKLDRLQRETKSYFFRKLFMYSKGMTLSFIEGNRVLTGSEANQITQIDFLCQSTNRNELHRKVIEFMSVADRIFLKRKGQGFKAIQGNISQLREKLKKRVEYVEANILKKLFFKRKFLCFSHIRFVAEKLKEKTKLDKQQATTTLVNFWKKKMMTSLIKYLKKWRKSVDEEKQRIFQQSKNRACQRMRKFFTDWRLAYIKKNNQKSKFKSGATKIMNALRKVLNPKLLDAFTILKKYEKRNMYKLIYIPADKQDKIIEIETPNIIITQTTNQSIDTPRRSICSEHSMILKSDKSKKDLRGSSSFNKNQLSVSQNITPIRDKTPKSPLPKSPNATSGNSSHCKKTTTPVALTVSNFCTKKKSNNLS